MWIYAVMKYISFDIFTASAFAEMKSVHSITCLRTIRVSIASTGSTMNSANV
jgi:hypothetical protein